MKKNMIRVAFAVALTVATAGLGSTATGVPQASPATKQYCC